jgi:hypothetical protein
MGELIPFYRPVPKAVLTVASKAEWDAQVTEEEPMAPAKEILETCLAKADTIDQIVVLTMDKSGQTAFFGNCDGMAETLLFMDVVKAQALKSLIADAGEDGGTIA